MTFKISFEQLQAIRAHAESAYPEECCGLLLGMRNRDDRPETRSLVQLWQTENAWERAPERDADEDSLGKTRRYWMDPKEILAAQRYARDRQLDILGVYHSHPDHPAVPSECDRRQAWAEYSYLIVSVLQGSAQDLLSWRLDENHQFQPEEIVPISTEDLCISESPC